MIGSGGAGRVGQPGEISDRVICHRLRVARRILARGEESRRVSVCADAAIGIGLGKQERIGVVGADDFVTQTVLGGEEIIMGVVGKGAGIVVGIRDSQEVMPAVIGHDSHFAQGVD